MSAKDSSEKLKAFWGSLVTKDKDKDAASSSNGSASVQRRGSQDKGASAKLEDSAAAAVLKTKALFTGLFKKDEVKQDETNGKSDTISSIDPDEPVKLFLSGGFPYSDCIRAQGYPKDRSARIIWYKATQGGMDIIEGAKGDNFQASAADVGMRVCAQWVPDDGGNPSSFAQIGPLPMDPDIEDEVAELVQHKLVAFFLHPASAGTQKPTQDGARCICVTLTAEKMAVGYALSSQSDMSTGFALHESLEAVEMTETLAQDGHDGLWNIELAENSLKLTLSRTGSKGKGTVFLLKASALNHHQRDLLFLLQQRRLELAQEAENGGAHETDEDEAEAADSVEPLTQASVAVDGVAAMNGAAVTSKDDVGNADSSSVGISSDVADTDADGTDADALSSATPRDMDDAKLDDDLAQAVDGSAKSRVVSSANSEAGDSVSGMDELTLPEPKAHPLGRAARSAGDMSFASVERAELKRKLSKSKQENAALVNHTRSLKEQLEHLRKELHVAEDARDTLAGELKAKNTELEQSRTAQKELQSQLKDAQKGVRRELKSSRAEQNVLKETIQSMSTQLANFHQEAETSSSERARLDAECKRLEREMDSVLSQAHASAASVADLRTQLTDLTTEKLSLKGDLASTQEKLKKSVAREGTLQRELNELRSKLVDTQKIDARLSQHNTERENLQLKVKSLTSKVDELTAAKCDLEALTEHLQEQANAAEQQKKDLLRLEGELKDSQASIASLQEELAQAIQSRDEHSQKAEELEQSVADLEEKLRLAEEHRSQAVCDLVDAKEELEQRVRAAELARDEMQAQRNNFKKKADSLSNDMKKMLGVSGTAQLARMGRAKSSGGSEADNSGVLELEQKNKDLQAALDAYKAAFEQQLRKQKPGTAGPDTVTKGTRGKNAKNAKTGTTEQQSHAKLLKQYEEMKSLANSLSETITEKDEALYHRRNVNQLLGRRVKVLQAKLSQAQAQLAKLGVRDTVAVTDIGDEEAEAEQGAGSASAEPANSLDASDGVDAAVADDAVAANSTHEHNGQASE